MVRPAIERFGLFGADSKLRTPADLVAYLGHAHQAGVHAKNVQFALEQLLGIGQDFFHFEVVEKVFGIVIKENGAGFGTTRCAGEKTAHWRVKESMSNRPAS